MSEMIASPPSPAASVDLAQALQRHFGYQRFRPGQEAIVRSVLEGRPTIAILPTGGGKSLCFQLPALLLPGTTVVASPLVALMKDQVDQLCARGIAATFINSSLSEAERQERQAQVRRGAYRLVYVAPERFRSSSFLQCLASQRIPLLAIDEAHCISAWGHDFRPDYQRLAQARLQINAERVLALTATATAEVRRDIAQALQLDKPRVFVAGFDRPNLFIEISKASGDKDKLGRLLALARCGGQGLVYAATRRNVEKIVAALRGHGVDAIGYHAGMEDGERTAVQDRYPRGGAEPCAAALQLRRRDAAAAAHRQRARLGEGGAGGLGCGGATRPGHARRAGPGGGRGGRGGVGRGPHARKRRAPRALARAGTLRAVRGAHPRGGGRRAGDRLRAALPAGGARAQDARPDGAARRHLRLPPRQPASLPLRRPRPPMPHRLRQLPGAARRP